MTPAQSLVSPSRLALSEHSALHALLDEVKAALFAREPHVHGGPDVVAARLDVLRGRLAAHFAGEESAGLFRQILELAPQRERLCSRLRGEHQGLLQRLDSLCAAAPESRRQADWGAGVRSVLDDLASHERHENDLIQEAFEAPNAAQD